MNFQNYNRFLTFLLGSCISCAIQSLPNDSDDKIIALKNNFTQKFCEEKSIQINNFSLINNQWGKYKIKEDSLSICVYANENDLRFGWEWKAPNKSFGVLAFPEIWFGSSAWKNANDTILRTSQFFPKSIFKIKKIESSFSTLMQVNNKKYNLCYDVWLHSNEKATQANIVSELMIWEDYNRFVPYGSRKEEISFSFGDYVLYQGSIIKKNIGLQWKYICLLRKNRRRVGAINLLEVLQYLIKTKVISSNYAISSIEFGTEILNSSGTIYIEKYNLNVE